MIKSFPSKVNKTTRSPSHKLLIKFIFRVLSVSFIHTDLKFVTFSFFTELFIPIPTESYLRKKREAMFKHYVSPRGYSGSDEGL